MQRALNATGRPIVYSINNEVNATNPGLANMWRTTPDTSNTFASMIKTAMVREHCSCGFQIRRPTPDHPLPPPLRIILMSQHPGCVALSTEGDATPKVCSKCTAKPNENYECGVYVGHAWHGARR
jgi:hypothetical protein